MHKKGTSLVRILVSKYQPKLHQRKHVLVLVELKNQTRENVALLEKGTGCKKKKNFMAKDSMVMIRSIEVHFWRVLKTE